MLTGAPHQTNCGLIKNEILLSRMVGRVCPPSRATLSQCNTLIPPMQESIILSTHVQLAPSTVQLWHKKLYDGSTAVALVNFGVFDGQHYNATLSSEMVCRIVMPATGVARESPWCIFLIFNSVLVRLGWQMARHSRRATCLQGWT